MKERRHILYIFVCIILFIAVFFRHKLFIWFELGSIPDLIICVVVLYISLRVILHSIYRILENRTKKNDGEKNEVKTVEIADLLQLIHDNDIIDINALQEDLKEYIVLGSSSCSSPGRNDLFDKHYYIGTNEYGVFDEFRDDLSRLFPTGKVAVISIDGLPCSDYNL